MLQKAVDIHFELNYKHLCSSPQDINDDEGSSGGSSPGGERTLQWALTASFFGNLAGTGCSNVCAAKIQRIEGLTKLIVTFGLNFLALATATVISFHPVLVVCLAVTLRFLDGYMSPLIFQAIAQQHDDVEERDAIVTIVAVVQSSVNFIAAWITFSGNHSRNFFICFFR